MKTHSSPCRVHRTLSLFCLALLASLPLAPRYADAKPTTDDRLEHAERLREDLREMIELARDKVFPALVNIHVSTVDYWGGKERKGGAVGSGTIISPEGYVVTNQHVTNKGKKFRCTLSDRQEIKAELVGEDPLTDLAVIKLDLSELKSPSTPLPVAHFGNSDDLTIGDYVMAMGSPHALSQSVTLGIVSNTQRVFSGSDDDVEEMELDSGQRTGLFTRWIQHDALIRPGNSGGPLVNLKGEIVGINELGGNGIGFAIPSNLAKEVVDALIKDGEVKRSWIGISIKSIQKTGYEKGALVNSVVDDGPAAKAGIQPGDLLLRIDGKATTIRFNEQIPPLMHKIADYPIGTKLKVAYQRGDKTHEATITTARLTKDRGDETSLRGWGLTAEEITDKLARDMKLTDESGAMVSGTRTGGPAELAEPALRYGDIIRRIDGEKIESLKALVERYRDIMDQDELPEYLLIEFDRQGKSQITLIKPKPEEPEDPPRDIRKAWIGIATQPIVEKLARYLKMKDTGFRITRVYPRTTAAKTDLKVGDIVVALNGNKFHLMGMQDGGLFQREVKKLDIGSNATLTVLRDDKPIDIKVQTQQTPWSPAEARRTQDRDFEMTVRNITFFDRDDNQWSTDVKGVIIEQTESGGWASTGGLRPGDLIQEIDGMRIRSRTSFRRAMKKVKKNQPERVVFKVLRGAQTRFEYVEPEWKPELENKADDSKAATDTDKE